MNTHINTYSFCRLSYTCWRGSGSRLTASVGIFSKQCMKEREKDRAIWQAIYSLSSFHNSQYTLMSGACSGAIHTGHVFESTCTVFQIVLLFKNHNVMEGATDLFFRVVMYIQVKQIEKKNVGRDWMDADLNASLQFK